MLGKSAIDALASFGKIYPTNVTIFYAVVGSMQATIEVGGVKLFS